MSIQAAPPVDEVEVVGRLRSGDEVAFNQLVTTHQSRLVRFAQLFVADQSVAEDVVQDTWMAVLRGLDAFEGRSSLKGWIFSILANRAKTRGVRERRTVAFSALASAEGDDVQAVAEDRFTSNGRWLMPPAPWDYDTPEKEALRT